ncbi:NADH-quinone oxidoreductase subunit C [Clostridium thermarum]|uniref:NADH-quinone oxidoreductase subunit C n=1 Tax=Clostridium thermarum TaxID=1716543 RepID=UPI00111D842B|nr:NADH-quinone oxidoreductase subunit C [Clostridium thermarum]
MGKFDGEYVTKEQLFSIAQKFREEKRRLVIINGYIDKEGNNVVAYNFEIDGHIKTYLCKGYSTLPSLTGIYGGSAQWCEEEICEFMPIDFESLEKSGRLFLPEEFDGSGQILVMPLSELKKAAEK